MTPEVLLEIDTKATLPHAKVRIDGQLYALRTRDDLAFVSHSAAQRAQQLRRLGELFKNQKPTDAQVRERRRLLMATARAVVDAPAQVLRRLRDGHCMAILQAFMEQHEPTRTR